MKTDTSEKIVAYIRDKGQASAKDLVNYLEISPQAVFRQLKKLQESGEIYKKGTPPRVFYFIREEEVEDVAVDLDDDVVEQVEDNFLIITPSGEELLGVDAFVYWCNKNNLDVRKTSFEYKKALQKYGNYKSDGLIDGMGKMNSTFDPVYLDALFYLDFYSIERFGKTKLGQLLLYAKQSQNKKIIKKLTEHIKSQIDFVIKKYKIDAVGFVPPTVKREVQFMHELKVNLALDRRIISIVKIKTDIIVPQKTLNKLNDRVENAQNTIFVDEQQKYGNILLIDDAVGSGATLNEVAKKIKEQNISNKVIGLALTGSFKGFDVISEV